MKKFFIFFLFNFFLLLFYFEFKNNSISLRLKDFYYFFNEKNPSNKVVFIEIGESSINKYGRWPWDREILAKLIKNIHAKVILLDIVFSEPTIKDKYLAKIISQKPIVCGFFLRNKATQNISDNQLDVLSDSVIEAEGKFISSKYAEVNVENILNSCTLNGVFSTFSDNDNIYRHYVLAYLYKGMVFPSLGVQGLRLYFNKDFEIKDNFFYFFDKKIKLNQYNALKLNYYKPQKYVSIPIDSVKNYNLKDKIAILGISELGISDIKSTPIGQIPGPLLHYTFISNILNGDYIKEISYLDTIITLFFIFLPFIIFYLTKKTLLRHLLYVVSLFIFLILAIFIYKKYNIQIELLFPILYFVLNIILLELYLYLQKEKREKFLKKAFSSYLSKEVMDEILKNPDKLKLGGEEKELSILFLDLRNFTSLAEKMSPEEVVQMINKLFSPFSDIIQKNKGMVDKYMGDAIMALFNAPLDIKDHAILACKSALEIMEKLNEINKKMNTNIDIGIGINTDKVYVGNMGSEKRFNYTAIGDGVNLASRLESKTKELNCKILISHSTYEKVKSYFNCTYMGEVKVKGKEEKIKVYSLNGIKKD